MRKIQKKVLEVALKSWMKDQKTSDLLEIRKEKKKKNWNGKEVIERVILTQMDSSNPAWIDLLKLLDTKLGLKEAEDLFKKIHKEEVRSRTNTNIKRVEPSSTEQTMEFFERNFPQGGQMSKHSIQNFGALAKKQQTELMLPGEIPQRRLTNRQQKVADIHISELSKRLAQKIVDVYAVVQKQGIPKKQFSVIKRDIQQFITDRTFDDLGRIVFFTDSIDKTEKQTFLDYIGKLAQAFFNEHRVTQQADQAYKKVLMNTRTKGKTIEGIYTSLLDNKIIFLRAIEYQEPANSAFERLLVDGFIFLILQHPNTPRSVVSAVLDRLRTFIKTRKKYESHIVPYLLDVLKLKSLGRKGVAELIKTALSKDADYMYLLTALIRNPMITGDEITKVFNGISSKAVKKQNLIHIEPVFIEIARNGKTAKSIRDKMMGVELGIDCDIDESMNIRMALASNPNLPKRDLQVLENDPCVSVALVARKYLKKRFKR